MKIYPVIGSKYTGPELDRPCLRRLPRGWVLDLPPDSCPGDTAVMLAAAFVMLGMAVLVLLGW